jgi:3-deoxy-D-manno-octulosonic-acid transferase
MRALYIVASYIVFAIAWPVLALMKKTRDGARERLGFYRTKAFPADGFPRIWLHGASAGDLLALSPMIDRFRAKFPGARVFVSTMTNTGALMARERLSKKVDAVLFAPWDLYGATRRAVAEVRPDLLVLEYTEIWPNLIHAAREHGAKVVLTNGRFSASSLPRYRWLFRLVGNPLHEVDLFLMREHDEAERALKLGAAAHRVRVTGNTKFDALIPPTQSNEAQALGEALGIEPDDRVWIAGSTHEGEEELLLDVYQQLLPTVPGLRLVIAPRYIDRATRIRSLVEHRGLKVSLRSQGNAERDPVTILDSIGELSLAYRLATVVFVGGSFTSRGGQNILEPAAQGRPVLFGPHMENFRDSVGVLQGRGGLQVKDADHLRRVLIELFSRPESLEALGALARQAVGQVSGASDRNVEAMAALVEGRLR